MQSSIKTRHYSITIFILLMAVLLFGATSRGVAAGIKKGYWKFNETSGSATADSSGFGYTGTINGAARISTGVEGWALSFDGVNDEVNVGNGRVATNGNYSVAAWVYLDASTGYRTIVSQDGANISAFFLQKTADNHFAFSLHTSDSTSSSAVRAQTTWEPAVGQWYHLVGVHDAGADLIKLYVNGQLASAQSYSSGWASSGTTVIGRARWGGASVDYLAGDLDEVTLYDNSLTDSEILTLYNSYVKVTPPAGAYVWSSPSWAPAAYDYGMSTPWASSVSPSNSLPDYPRMQMRRDNWLNLNGVWQIKQNIINERPPSNQNFVQGILVPFPVESALGGVKQPWDRVWYRRVFTVPASWNGSDRILLNFGAVDFEAEVFVNGQSVGHHYGGYDEFSFDITPALREPRSTTNQELLVRVYDPTNAVANPTGKQSNNPGGIFYTSTTGIWKTVWIEPASATRVASLKITPNIDTAQLQLSVNTIGSTGGVTVDAIVRDGGATVATVTGQPANANFNINIPNQKLWSPNNPFLYDLEVNLKVNGVTVDNIDSYFGMRKISIGTVNGYRNMFLNNQPIFQRGVLDQGFWPDGIYTAPTDAALRWDVETSQALGFNMIRKHVKVEPDRWYYWADKLGMIVWQDMVPPNVGASAYPEVEAEMQETINELYNHPSIALWVVYNEGWGEPDAANVARVTNMVDALDPTRIVNQASGWTDYGGGDVLDFHCYPGPCSPNVTNRINAVGEYGGITYQIAGHIWDAATNPCCYPGEVNNLTDYEISYSSKTGDLFNWAANGQLNAYVYTQLTDVERERNGIITYDRAVIKTPQPHMASFNNRLPLTMITPTAREQTVSWRYTTAAPASNWYATNFSDAAWAAGNGGFGTAGTPGAIIGTTWNTADIWMRRSFNASLPASLLDQLYFKLHHDEEMQVYLNGTLVLSTTGYTSGYGVIPFSTQAKQLMNLNGTNVLAVHVHQSAGGQYSDVGIGYLPLTMISPSAREQAVSWRYTTAAPASNWYATSFNDGAWGTGNGGFGTAGTPGAIIGTTWNTADIWMRRSFSASLPASSLDQLYFKLHHDEEMQVYLNGILVLSVTGYTTEYQVIPLTALAKQAMILNGTNVIAVHVHQSVGGQYSDVGIGVAP